MTLLLCWDFKVAIAEAEAIANEHRWGYWIYQAAGTPVLAAVSALTVRIGADYFVR